MTRSYWTDKQDRAYESACIHFADHGEIRIGNGLDHVDIKKSDVIEKMLEDMDNKCIDALLKATVSQTWPSVAKMCNLMGNVRDQCNATANEMIADAITDYVEPR